LFTPGQAEKLGLLRSNVQVRRPRLNINKNARLSPVGRALMISRIEQESWSAARAAKGSSV